MDFGFQGVYGSVLTKCFNLFFLKKIQNFLYPYSFLGFKTCLTEMALAPSFLNIYEISYQLWVLWTWGYGFQTRKW